jgi:protein gp37
VADQRDGGIAWSDETWNPIRGCRRVSPGCENCYAEAVASRFCGPGLAYEGLAIRKLVVHQDGTEELRGRWTGTARVVPEHIADPLRWRRPRRIFVNSMSDLFHEDLPFATIAAIFGIMAAAPRHTFQVLTKRPERMLEWFAWMEERKAANLDQAWGTALLRQHNSGMVAIAGGLYDLDVRKTIESRAWPLANVWLGVTAEDQQRADERIPKLLRAPAAVRFVSVEPQLEHVRLDHIDADRGGNPECQIDALSGRHTDMGRPCPPVNRLDWVICGAESGRGARHFRLDWARALRDQCVRAGVAFFLKQVIGMDGKKVSTPPLDGKVWAEFPR